MQFLLFMVGLLLVASTDAFCPQHKKAFTSKTSLRAQKDWWAPAAAAAIGWTLASQIAVAGIPPGNEREFVMRDVTSSSVIVSKGNSDQKSMLEMYTDPGADEKQKQELAMKKAEAARQARLVEKKEAAKKKVADDLAREKLRLAEQKANNNLSFF
eukprot:CAMPEP_0194265780 /NCGR_PEP_ID=MMETSP0169-20130528/903_1 /TAXON_ID=218684 /ORGANISM="Corethron pennatum, Strain L29A3" /LENGTH=155 /DNA_ID=CAMNT_0039006319 /DNA_START=90 /DNA_END=557 /DNA_ORIENTATION=+